MVRLKGASYSLKLNFVTASLVAIAVPVLGLSSINTWLAGLAWLFISLAGIVAWLGHKAAPSTQTPIPTHPALPAARWWLLACLAAFVLMAVATTYWNGPWPERHPQWRLLIGALGLWCLLRYSAPSARTVQALATAAAISSLLAYGLVITNGSSAAPTSRIPWMAGLALLSCALLNMSYSLRSAAIQLRQFWLTASAVMLITALLSGVRGSWPLLLVWPIMLWRLHGSTPVIWHRAWKWLLPLLAVLLMVGLHFVSESDNPTARIKQVLQETATLQNEAPESQNSSSGIRLALYKLSMLNVLDHPWMGVGPDKTKQLIQGKLTDIGASSEVGTIVHMHSDLLHPWVEFGFFGLVGYLVYVAGLIVAAWHLGRTASCPGLHCGMVSLLVIHLSTGMTNMNFAHNYYPLMLALSMTLVMLGCFDTKSQTDAQHKSDLDLSER